MKKLTSLLSLASGRADIVLGVLLITAVFMMILPLPTILIDVLIAINLTLSCVLLITAIYLRDPLEFSVFPTLLLVTTLYRLALTVSTSRLILMQHDAGEIVTAFGQFVVGGNLAVGIIVFSIITVVQFIVITKGAERVAEVGARFSLDGMPGKQMSIDGDMRAGVIDGVEAKRLRGLVQKGSQLYGAMDGAMKFVKGDAIASIIVVLVNIIGGVVIGVVQQGMEMSQALSMYAVLSIGDGLIAQIPALIISITAGIVVTRVPDDERNNLAGEMFTQLLRHPQALFIVAAMMAGFALLPGFPAYVFLPLAASLAGLAFHSTRKAAREKDPAGSAGKQDAAQDMTPGADPLIVRVSTDAGHRDEIAASLDRMRWRKFQQVGVAIPEVSLQMDASLPAGALRVLIYNEPVVSLQMREEHALIDARTRIAAPAHVDRMAFGGLTLRWADAAQADALATTGAKLLTGHERVAGCVEQAIDRFAGEFIGVQESRHLMDAMEDKYPELVKELQRQLQVSKVAEVLQRLVSEGISIRDLRTIFEALIEWAPKEKDAVMLTEYVRIALRRQIVIRHARDGVIAAWMIGEEMENLIRGAVRQTSAGSYSSLPQHQIDFIVKEIRDVTARRGEAGGVLLTAIDVRRFVRKFIERDLFEVPVLSFQEIGDEVSVNVLANIEFTQDQLEAEADDALA